MKYIVDGLNDCKKSNIGNIILMVMFNIFMLVIIFQTLAKDEFSSLAFIVVMYIILLIVINIVLILNMVKKKDYNKRLDIVIEKIIKDPIDGEKSLESFVRVFKRELDKKYKSPRFDMDLGQSISHNVSLSGQALLLKDLETVLHNLKELNEGSRF